MKLQQRLRTGATEHGKGRGRGCISGTALASTKVVLLALRHNGSVYHQLPLHGHALYAVYRIHATHASDGTYAMYPSSMRTRLAQGILGLHRDCTATSVCLACALHLQHATRILLQPTTDSTQITTTLADCDSLRPSDAATHRQGTEGHRGDRQGTRTNRAACDGHTGGWPCGK